MENKYFKGLDKLFSDYANEIENNVKDVLSWTDNLKNDVQATGSEKGIEISMPLYGLVVDKGRRPGAKMPPFGKDSPLVPWIVKKFGLELKEAENICFVVARSIGKKGIPARPWIDEAIDMKTLSNQIATLIVKNMIREIEVKENQGMFIKGRIPHNKKTM